MKTVDYISYIDTDSLFIKLYDFLLNNGITQEQWEKLPEDRKIHYISKLSKAVENNVNERSFSDIQIKSYNSKVDKDDFTIEFKQEIICKRALFITKKKYGYHVVNEEGFDCDKIDVTGLEIIRSETPSIFREALKDVLSMILKGASDDDIRSKVETYKIDMKNAKPEEISSNISVKNIRKYSDEKGQPIKGTPWHVKGALNYHFLLKHLKLEDNYEKVYEAEKAKVVYVKKNPFNIEVVSYKIWPKEFDDVLQVDYQRQLDKFFLKKVEFLLEPMNKEYLIDNSNQVMELFF